MAENCIAFLRVLAKAEALAYHPEGVFLAGAAHIDRL